MKSTFEAERHAHDRMTAVTHVALKKVHPYAQASKETRSSNLYGLQGSPQTDRQTSSFIDNSIEAGILLGKACAR